MEVFRYWTASKFEEAQALGRIESNNPTTFPRFPKHVFVLPDNPLIWGIEKTRLILRDVGRNHKLHVHDDLILIKFAIKDEELEVFIRDLYGEDEWAWYPIASHKPQLFQYPEMIVPTPISTDKVIQLPIPSVLREENCISGQ